MKRGHEDLGRAESDERALGEVPSLGEEAIVAYALLDVSLDGLAVDDVHVSIFVEERAERELGRAHRHHLPVAYHDTGHADGLHDMFVFHGTRIP
jgi:hypothetical protein